MNGDGLSDFIFKWRRAQLQDEDTLFVTIYIQNKDSSFSNFYTFHNLFPLYFENYSSDDNDDTGVKGFMNPKNTSRAD